MKMDIKYMEKLLSELPEGGDRKALYVETGKYKPWSMATVLAAKRRGYRVEKHIPGVYSIYKKGSA